MKNYDGLTIEILKWEDFNPRKDITSPTWFRVNHGIFEEPKFYSLVGTDWTVLLYFMCQVSKTNNNRKFVLNCDHAKRVAQIKPSQIAAVIEKLKASQFIAAHVTPPYADVTPTNVDGTFVALTDVRTNERNDTVQTPESPVVKIEDVERCKATWLGTLKHFGVDRTILESEELEIFRAIKGQKGNAKIVELALFGAAFEPAHEGFNPKDYVKISRIFRPSKNGDSKLPDFVNWGAKKRAEIKADEYRKAKDEKIEEEVERCDPATVRAILEKTFPTSRRMAQEGA